MLLITGWPGVGKTTAVRAVAERLRARGARVDGFVTLERRDAATGARVGFDAVSILFTCLQGVLSGWFPIVW